MKIMEKDKIFKALICIGIVLCSVFLVGMKDVNAYDTNEEAKLSFEFDNPTSFIDAYNKAPYKIIIKESANVDNKYCHYFFSNKPFKLKVKHESSSSSSIYCYNEDGTPNYVSFWYGKIDVAPSKGYQNGVMSYMSMQFSTSNVTLDMVKSRIYYSNADVYLGNDKVFQVPLVKVAESLTPVIQGETKMIIPTAVGLLGLLILSMRLLPGLKTFFRG